MAYGRKIALRAKPFLHGNRYKAFNIVYDSHYGRQSEQAHQRAAAISAALVVDDPSAQILVDIDIARKENRSQFVVHTSIFNLQPTKRDLAQET